MKNDNIKFNVNKNTNTIDLTYTSIADHDDLTKQIRNAGESLIKNSHSIAGDEKYCGKLVVTITFDADKLPVINISREFYPEHEIEQ